jgi:DNA-binding PadR family transcriptional regulator
VASWRASALGPRRRYYRITAKGLGALAALETEWATFTESVRLVTAPDAR